MNRGSATRARAALVLSGRCFNEAPIHESGKFALIRFTRKPITASMRPRFMNRGSCEKLDCFDCRKRKLQ